MPPSFQPMFLRNLFARMTGKEVALKGGLTTAGIVRVGSTVRRPVTEKSAFAHDLLRYLENRGFDGVPRFLGIDDKGRAMLTYIHGDVHRQIGGFQKEQWVACARRLRLFHDATADCELKGQCEVICHGDPGPPNFVFRDGLPFGLIDFDSAHPGRREADVGHAAWMWLHIGNHKLDPEEQGSKLVDFVAAYDPAATWNPLELVLQAQQRVLAKLPRGLSLKWSYVKTWAQACVHWTWHNRDGISAGIAMRSGNSPREHSVKRA